MSRTAVLLCIVVLLFGGFWHTPGNTLFTTTGCARSCALPRPCICHKKARSICARRHHLQWWRHAGDAGARESVRPVPARRRHAYLRPTIHERDAKALCLETPTCKRRCRPVVEAGVVGRPDPPLRAVEEPLRRRTELPRDLEPERNELRASLEILVVLQAVAPSCPFRALAILCLLRQLSRVVFTVAAARCVLNLVLNLVQLWRVLGSKVSLTNATNSGHNLWHQVRGQILACKA